MAGVAGTTLADELNRLANGGATYPSTANYLDADGAANVWAGTSGLSLIGALNTKAGNAQSAWLALNGVCNQLGGTVGEEAVTALRARAS